MDDVTLYHGDCLEIMKTIPDKSIDLVLTDPPYGINIGTTIGGGKPFGSSGRGEIINPKIYRGFDDTRPPQKETFDEIFRISKNQIIFGANHFISKIPFDSPCWIVWDKDNSGNFADCELAWTSFKTAVRKYEFRWNGMLQGDMKNKEFRHHPTQKPVALLKAIMRDYSEKDFTILDPFMGSGTTGIASIFYGRKFIGIEIDKTYFEIAKKRIENTQKELFV